MNKKRCEKMFRAVVEACDPAKRVANAISAQPMKAGDVYGIAVGKAAQAMARGAGRVKRGVCVSHYRDAAPLPLGWELYLGAHPVPDESSLVAGDAVIDLVASARANDQILALISGGASAMIERPAIPFAQFREEIAAVMSSGASIREINRARIQRSLIKGGKLAERSLAPIRTLIVSDVIGDAPEVIGSGPTIAHRERDSVEVVAPMESALDAMQLALEDDDPKLYIRRLFPLEGDVEHVARELAALASTRVVAGGEPTLVVPDDHGEGGRAQHLALLLARAFAGRGRCAFVVGTDGVDGPATRGAQTPAGAFVDGRTWERIRAAGIDPEHALVRRDSSTALRAAGALVVTGPTGINHGDLVMLG
ncbi:MAG: DUF4147 domain-containing protein [Kofleriaceae bacterium]